MYNLCRCKIYAHKHTQTQTTKKHWTTMHWIGLRVFNVWCLYAVNFDSTRFFHLNNNKPTQFLGLVFSLFHLNPLNLSHIFTRNASHRMYCFLYICEYNIASTKLHQKRTIENTFSVRWLMIMIRTKWICLYMWQAQHISIVVVVVVFCIWFT